MTSTQFTLGIVDYVVISIFLLISAGIGIMFRIRRGKHQTVNEYLLAGRNMSLFPVILSTTATLISTGTMLGTPAEIYRYGLQAIVQPFATALGMYLTVYVFVPVYFQCGVSTVYEFIEMRFGKYTRIVLSMVFLLQMMLGMSPSLYGPALALSAVTDLSLKMSIIVIGGVCIFYCAMGGLKAVLWTDVLQGILMFVFITAFYSVGVDDGGGISTIYERAKIGNRLEIFNFSFDLTVRYTFWNCFWRGFLYGFGAYGTNQLEIQRLLSMSDGKRAQRCLLVSIFPIFVFHCLSMLAGLVLYSIYYLCDPMLNRAETGLTKYDQMVPYYIIRRLNAYPGLTGLCIAGIFSGSLSSISSALNCVSTVTVVDYIQPLYSNFTERKNVMLAKSFNVIYGLIGIGLAFAFSYVQSIKQFGITLYAIQGGSVAIFLIGSLTRKADDKCVFLGILFSYPIIIWIALGSLISGYMESPLELSTENCPVSQNITSSMNSFTECTHNGTVNLNSTCFSRTETGETFILYKISYLWLPFLSAAITGLMVFLMVIITGWNRNVIEEDSRCLSPVTRFWSKKAVINRPCLIPASDFKNQISISKTSNASAAI